MPTTSQKISKFKRLNATVVLHGTDVLETELFAKQYAKVSFILSVLLPLKHSINQSINPSIIQSITNHLLLNRFLSPFSLISPPFSLLPPPFSLLSPLAFSYFDKIPYNLTKLRRNNFNLNGHFFRFFRILEWRICHLTMIRMWLLGKGLSGKKCSVRF